MSEGTSAAAELLDRCIAAAKSLWRGLSETDRHRGAKILADSMFGELGIGETAAKRISQANAIYSAQWAIHQYRDGRCTFDAVLGAVFASCGAVLQFAGAEAGQYELPRDAHQVELNARGALRAATRAVVLMSRPAAEPMSLVTAGAEMMLMFDGIMDAGRAKAFKVGTSKIVGGFKGNARAAEGTADAFTLAEAFRKVRPSFPSDRRAATAVAEHFRLNNPAEAGRKRVLRAVKKSV